MNRDEAKTLIARQIAVSEGLVWERIDHKRRAALMTLADCILATVERKGQVRW